MKVLIIEDNEAISKNIIKYLSLKNIQAEASFNGKDGLYKALVNFYDVIILDINLPEKNGLEVCRELREKEKETPVIMLTSNSSKKDIINGLNSGADDYLVKPFDYEELLARINTLNRRNLKNKSITILKAGEYKIDLEKILVLKGNEEIKLSTLEFNLFKYLAQNKARVISRKELYEKVWGEFDGDFMFSKTVDVYIGYLRKKLDREIIQTKKGYGYIINK